MKKFHSLLFVALLPILASAYDAEIDGIYYNFSGDEATIIDCEELINAPGWQPFMNPLVIPQSISYDGKTYNVTSIGNNAFENCEGLLDVIISDGITYIGNYAFKGCYHLTSITIPNSVTFIGMGAFYDCGNLTDVYCYAENLPRTRADAFEDYLIEDATLHVPAGTAELYRGVSPWEDFGTIVEMEEGPEIHAKIDGIYYILSGNEATVTYHNYSDYSGKVIIPESVTYNGKIFRVTSIGDLAFKYCSDMTSVTIPNTVTSIGYDAFSDCHGITSITIPSSITSIGRNAFSYCSNLKKVIVPDIAAWCNISYGDDAGIFGASNQNPLYCAHHLFSDEETEITDLVIPDGVTSIGNAAFHGCTGLTSVTIPNSVTSIGGSAFYECRGLTSVTIPDGVTSIGWRSFFDCSSLTSITIPNSVTTIGSYAFRECSGLTSITIPNSVTSIADYTFYGCSGLTSVTIPEGVTEIGEDAFCLCSGLTSITFPESLITIGRSAFNSCTGLTSVTIPNSVTSIGGDAFYYCSGLTEVTIPEGVTEIGSGAFGYCSGLTEITIPSSVTSIGYYAFNNCSKLTTIRVLRETPAATDRVVCSNSTYETATLYIPVGSLDAYKADEVWSQFKNIRDILCFVNVIATGGGTLTFNEETIRNDSKRVIFEQGSDVTFEGKPDENYDFTSLTVNGEAVTTANGIYTLANLQSHIDVVATFTEKPKFDITATATGGTVSLNGATPSASQSIKVYRDTDVTLTIKPNEGHELSKITVNGSDGSAQLQNNTLKFENIQEAKTIVVTFTKYIFNVSVSGAGVSVSNTRPEYGDDVTVTIDDDPDRTLVSLLVNGEDVTAEVVDGQYIIQYVTGNVTVEATFKSTKEFITLTDEYAMFSCDQDLDFTDSDLSAYIALGFNKATNQVLLVRVYDVPAGTGVFLIGERKTHKIPYAETSSIYMNFFQANLEKSTIYATAGSYSNYIFSEQDGTPGFYPVIDYTTLMAKTAYLHLPSTFVAAGVKVSVVFEEDIIDGIEDFRISDTDETIYDLAGRRLGKMQKGINIQNGKKIIRY